MFHTDRWTAAFIAVTGEYAGDAFACLTAIVPPAKAISGALFGTAAARRMEGLLRECSAQTGVSDTGAEYAIRFISLLIEKNGFKNIDSVIEKIGETIDRQRGIIAVTLESAVPAEPDLIPELERQIAGCVGAAGVKIKNIVRPELLGGLRLRTDGYCVDASLKGQIEKMKTELEKAALAAAAGGGL